MRDLWAVLVTAPFIITLSFLLNGCPHVPQPIEEEDKAECSVRPSVADTATIAHPHTR